MNEKLWSSWMSKLAEIIISYEKCPELTTFDENGKQVLTYAEKMDSRIRIAQDYRLLDLPMGA